MPGERGGTAHNSYSGKLCGLLEGTSLTKRAGQPLLGGFIGRVPGAYKVVDLFAAICIDMVRKPRHPLSSPDPFQSWRAAVAGAMAEGDELVHKRRGLSRQSDGDFDLGRLAVISPALLAVTSVWLIRSSGNLAPEFRSISVQDDNVILRMLEAHVFIHRSKDQGHSSAPMNVAFSERADRAGMHSAVFNIDAARSRRRANSPTSLPPRPDQP